MPRFYQFLDLPAIPDHYLDIALSRAATFSALPEEQRLSQRTNPLHRPERPVLRITRNGQSRSGRTAPRTDFADILHDWVNHNISTEWNQINVGVNLPPIDGAIGDATVAHTDTTRSHVLIYLLETSNADQATVWYREQGQPLHRKRNTTVEDYSKLIELERAVFPVRTWVMLDATVIHGVENVSDQRTAIHVGFDIDPFGVTGWAVS